MLCVLYDWQQNHHFFINRQSGNNVLNLVLDAWAENRNIVKHTTKAEDHKHQSSSDGHSEPFQKILVGAFLNNCIYNPAGW